MGDLVDLHSFLLKVMDHGVVTLTPCQIARVPHSALRRISEQHAHLTRLLWLDTLIDAAIHRQWIVGMGRRSGLGRFAHLLCEMCLRLESVGQVQDGGFLLPLTQHELGDVRAPWAIRGLRGLHGHVGMEARQR